MASHRPNSLERITLGISTCASRTCERGDRTSNNLVRVPFVGDTRQCVATARSKVLRGTVGPKMRRLPSS